ncbi:hypothetical protein O181_088074 [Austropuccinia psidii MF-1]|uniref:Integrase catalytic domain-containing protein n=1 Tax=Austropuccinia psidii MF-1 TaxID=1389203 RepID=A0A9Q3P2V9_9BASI|nr:hypothetical protein [Austropuccinia psidii MF-1]
MDFITQFPLSNSFDSILVIVDRFSKMAVFIPTMSSITSLDFSHLFINDMFSKHGLPSRVVSDRVSLFAYSFWTNLCQQLKISRDLSTAYHPETDGLTERVNQIPEQYLQIYVCYHQDDWNTWLPLAEFDYNNSDHSSTKQSPFFTFLEEIHNFTQFTLLKILLLDSYQQKFNKSRASPPVFNPGDMVWLSTKNIKSTRPTKILSEIWLGPFPILNKVSTHAYNLKFPYQWKLIHPFFHISLLEPVKTLKIPNRHQELPPPIIIQEEEEWKVSQILDSKIKRGKLWYFVGWEGFSQNSEIST